VPYMLLLELSLSIDVLAAPTKDHPQVMTISPTQVRKHLRKRRGVSLRHGIAFVPRHEHADAPHAVALLPARRERPSHRAAEEGDEVAAPNHSITSSAMASSVGGMVRPIVLAVSKLITNSNLVGCTTGKS